MCTATLGLALASAATVGGRGIWRLAEYHFDVEEFWPEALRIGRALHELPRVTEPRWLFVGSSIVLYDVIPESFERAVATVERPPNVRTLATPRAVFTDASALTQLAHAAAPVHTVVAGVHPRDFSVGVDPRTTLVANIFDRSTLDVPALAGGSPARRLERGVATVWPAFRTRRLQTRVFHAFLPDVPPPSGMREQPLHAAQATHFDGENTPTANNPQLDELHRWAAWCRERGIRPVVVYFPEQTGAADAHWDAAHGAAWIATLDRACAAAGIAFVNARDAMPRDAFFDFNHLHEQGAVRFSEWLGTEIARELAAAP